MPKDGFTNLTVDDERITKIRRDFDRLKPAVEQSFNTWALDVMESAIFKSKFLNEQFSNLKNVEIDEAGFAVYDKETKQVITITISDGKISCDASTNPEKYIQYACIHPKFRV